MSEPVRLSDHDDPDSPEGRAGRLLRNARALPSLGVAARHELRWRIRATLDDRRTLVWRVLRPAIVAILLLTGGAVLGLTADRMLGKAPPPPAGRTPMPVAPPAPPPVVPAAPSPALPTPPPRVARAVKRAPRLVASSLVPAPFAPQPLREAAPPEVAPPADREDKVPASPPHPWPRDEQTLFASALHQLRGVGNARAALAALDQLGRDYPRGMFAPEAASLRAEALMLLERPADALSALEGTGRPSGPGALVVRGELHLALGRLRDAADDFSAALNSGVPDNADDALVLERALWGRLQARVRLGDAPGARADADDYLRRFPAGRFAAGARRLIR